MAVNEFYRVYVWELPTRFFHWVNVGTILILIATGLLIGNPPAIMSGTEATDQYWFGINRFIHFAAAYIFAFNMISRIIWGFFGNKYIKWKSFFPFSKVKFQNLKHVLKMDIFLKNPEKFEYSHFSVGHNSFASLAYLSFFVVTIFQVMTGFGLYADNSTWWFPQLFGWVVDVMGGDAQTRLWHHMSMWVTIIFTVAHVYFVIYHDWLEGRGEISSMFGGYKFIRKERVEGSKKKN